MFKDRERTETIFGVLFGIVAVAAALIEMALDSFSAAAIVSAIKDVAGTAIVFVVMLAFISEHKKAPGIRGTIENEMKEIEKAYTPLIRQAVARETSGANKVAKLEKVIRYEIAGNTDALFGTKGKNYSAFFDINAENPQRIEFYIRPKCFKVEDETFDAEWIAGRIEQYMKSQHPQFNMTFSPDQSGGMFVIDFPEPLKSKKDVETLISIIDDMAFVYVAIKNSK